MVTKFQQLYNLLDNMPDTDECVHVPFKALHEFGYGQVKHKGKVLLAHRLSLEYTLGRPLGKGEFSLHKCDNPACINPKHLYPGTQKQNMEDKLARGRHRFGRRSLKGELNGMAKLNPDKVKLIRELRSQGQTQKQIAIQVGVSQAHVSKVLLGQTWQHVA